MIWSSWSSFFHMGGYGLYVWGSFLMTFLCITGELWLNASNQKTLFTQLNQIARLTHQDRQQDKQNRNET